MIRVFHGMDTMNSTVLEDIRVAREVGYEGIELSVHKVDRYLGSGHTEAELRGALEAAKLVPTALNPIIGFETPDAEKCASVMADVEKYSRVASAIGCPRIQLGALTGLADRSEEEMFRLTADRLRTIADVGAKHGIAFQVEPIAWSPIHTFSQALHLFELTDRSNVGLVIDFWHAWAGGNTTQEVEKLDRNIIMEIGICDGRPIPIHGKWVEADCRAVLTGEGEIDVPSWVAAGLKTGYDGPWATKLYSPYHWEWENTRVAAVCLERMTAAISAATGRIGQSAQATATPTSN